MNPIVYPQTRQSAAVEEHFGHTITDLYRWLESDPRSDDEVSAWIKTQNELTQNHLANLPGRAVFAERMAALLDYQQISVPVKKVDRYFYTRNSGRENQSKLVMRDGIDGLPKVLIDPNQWTTDSGDALAEWSPSDDGTMIAYAVQQGGTDWRTILVLNVESGQVLEDRIEWARFTDIAWAPDGSGFFYARFPKPDDNRSAAEIANHAVYFHPLGVPQADDRLIYSDESNPGNLTPLGRTADGRYLTISPTPGAGANKLAVVDLESEDWAPRFLVTELVAVWAVVDNVGTQVYATTDLDAEFGKVVVFDLTEPRPASKDVIVESDAVLNNVALMGGRFVVAYLEDAKTVVRRFLLNGETDGFITLPSIGSAGGFKGQFGDDQGFFIFSTFDTPITVYRYHVAENRYEAWAEHGLSADFEDVTVEQRFYSSKDGTRVPLFIVRRRDLAGPAPTLLYAYGGFGISMVPIYNALQMAWVEQGGVLAIANIRGGGEYGRAWHEAGQLANRQNSFDDYIAAGDYLIAEGLAAADGLVAQGESNGGLLVAVATNQRPDLFAASLPGVGVMDMLRFHNFTAGGMWMLDFGSPEDPEHFMNLLAYSPYHNIQNGKPYPAVLATTADTDDRVVPAHTFKYIAALQAADLGDKPRLARIETRAGHGSGMPLDKIIALHADQWAFAAHWAGLAVRPVHDDA